MAIEITRDLNVLVRAPLSVDKTVIDCFVMRHADWIDKAIEKQKQKVHSAAQTDITPEREAALRRLAYAVLPSKTEYYGRIMGMLPTRVKITSQKCATAAAAARTAFVIPGV